MRHRNLLLPIAASIFLSLNAPIVWAQAKNSNEAMTIIYGHILSKNDAYFTDATWFLKVRVTFTDKKLPLAEKAISKDVFCFRMKPRPTKAVVHVSGTKYEDKASDPAVSVDEPVDVLVQEIPISHTTISNGDRAQARTAVLHNLNQEAELARQFGSEDLYQYRAAYLAYEYRDHPEVSEAIRPYLIPSYQKLYTPIIACNEASSPEVEPLSESQTRQILSIAFGESASNVFPGIRAEAIQALASAKLTQEQRGEFEAHLGEQVKDSSSLLFRTSRVALARMGIGLESLAHDAEGNDRERALAAIIAIGKVKTPDGEIALQHLISGSADDPDVKRAAQKFLNQWGGEPVTVSSPLETTYNVWANGITAPGLKYQSFTGYWADHSTPQNRDQHWCKEVTINNESFLQVDYPGDDRYGIVQFYVAQPEVAATDNSRSTAVVVDIRSTTTDDSIKVGLSGTPPDQNYETGFEDSFPVSTYQIEHFTNLRVERLDQLTRLKNLKVIQLTIKGMTKKQFLIRRIYFAAPATGGATP